MSFMKYLKKKRLSSDQLHHHAAGRIEIEPRQKQKGSKETNLKQESSNLDEEEIKRRLAIPLNPDDFFKIEDALLLIAEDPPIVARSTPKNLIPTERSRSWSEKEMAHCLYDRSVYEGMIKNSLIVCEKLQENLDTYVNEVRKSPSCNFIPTKNN